MKTVIRSGSARSHRPTGLRIWLPVLLAAAFATSAQAQSAPVVEHSVKVHAGLYEVVTSTEDGTVWVAAVGSALVPGARLVGLDPVTLAERRSIDMEEAPAYGLGINNRTQTIYTSNTRAGNMSAVNLRTGEVTIIPHPEPGGNAHLFRVLVDEVNNLVYSSVAADPGSIWVVDGSTNRLRNIIENVGARPTGLALDAERNRLFASNINDNEIAVVDLATGQVVSRIPTGGERSTQLAFDPATMRLFVTNQGTHDISVLDVSGQGRLIQKIPTGEQALSVAFSPASNRLYVANRSANTLTVLNATTYDKVADLEIGSFPNTVHIDENTGRVYVTNKARGAPRGEPPILDPDGDKVSVLSP